MTRCPACGRRYDAGALFCPADGTALVAGDRGPPPGTAPRAPGDAMSASGELDRLLSLPHAEPVPASLPAVPPAADPPRRLGGVIAVLVALVVGMGALAVWQQKQTAAAERDRAEQAERRAADAQRAADDATNVAADAAFQGRDAAEQAQMQSAKGDTGDGTTVWANSPNDGFLALRSGPGVSGGTRLLKIPHGQPLTLGDCLDPTTSPGGRYGAWCRARYAGTDGWVFDAFVSR